MGTLLWDINVIVAVLCSGSFPGDWWALKSTVVVTCCCFYCHVVSVVAELLKRKSPVDAVIAGSVNSGVQVLWFAVEDELCENCCVFFVIVLAPISECLFSKPCLKPHDTNYWWILVMKLVLILVRVKENIFSHIFTVSWKYIVLLLHLLWWCKCCEMFFLIMNCVCS